MTPITLQDLPAVHRRAQHDLRWLVALAIAALSLTLPVGAPKYSTTNGGRVYKLVNGQPPPWKLFVDQVTQQAKASVEVGTRSDSVILYTLAQSVVQDIERMRQPDVDVYGNIDPRLDRYGRDFGATFAAVLWNTNSRTSAFELEYGGAVRPGAPKSGTVFGTETFKKEKTPIWNGMRPQPGCGRDNFYDRHAPSYTVGNETFLLVGSFGWPCYFGGSIAFTAKLADGSFRNCMVFYHVVNDLYSRLSPQRKAFHQQFNRLLEDCKGAQPRFKEPKPYLSVDLTAFAVCLETVFRPNSASIRREIKGIAVVPGGDVNVDPAKGPIEIPFFGYRMPAGGVLYRTLDLAGSVTNPFTYQQEPPRVTVFIML